MRRVFVITGIIILICLTVVAQAHEFDVNQYTWEELIEIKSLVEQKIEEYQIQDIIENGDRTIEISENEIIVYAGTTKKVDVSVIARHDSAPKNTILTWKSDHPEIASVTNGTIKGISAGDASITVSAKDNEYISKAIQIHVVNSVKSLTIAQKELNLLLGKEDVHNQEDIKAEITPADAYNQQLTWTSSDESIVKVDENGHVTAMSGGKAIISVSTNDPSLKQQKTAKCQITVLEAVSSVSISTSSITLGKGSTEKLSVTIYPETATKKDLIWSSSDESIATVSKGIIKALHTGNCTITCTAADGSGKQDTCEVTIIQQITSISPGAQMSSNISLQTGGRKSITTSIQPSDASNKKLHWTTSNSSVVELENTSGQMTMIKAKSAGTATITGTATDGSQKSITFTVSVEKPFTVVDSMYGNLGTSWGTKWFINQYKNTSASRTVDGITIKYYAEDIYGNKIKAFGYGDIYQEEIINITIGPGQTKSIPKIYAYGYDEAKKIHVAVIKAHYTDGTTVENDTPVYYYWEY